MKSNCSKYQLSAGFTLIELLVAASITTIVVSLAGSGLVSIMQNNNKTEAETLRRMELNRALDFISDEVRTAKTIAKDASANLSTVAPGFNPLGRTPVLTLEIPGVSQRVIYYIASPPSNSIWSGPKVIYRWGPTFGADGKYTNATNVPPVGCKPFKDCNPSSWDGNALVDLIADTTPASATTCPPLTSANPSIDNGQGFTACVDPSGRIAEIFLRGKLTGSSKTALEVSTKAFPRPYEITLSPDKNAAKQIKYEDAKKEAARLAEEAKKALEKAESEKTAAAYREAEEAAKKYAEAERITAQKATDAQQSPDEHNKNAQAADNNAAKYDTAADKFAVAEQKAQEYDTAKQSAETLKKAAETKENQANSNRTAAAYNDAAQAYTNYATAERTAAQKATDAQTALNDAVTYATGSSAPTIYNSASHTTAATTADQNATQFTAAAAAVVRAATNTIFTTNNGVITFTRSATGTFRIIGGDAGGIPTTTTINKTEGNRNTNTSVTASNRDFNVSGAAGTTLTVTGRADRFTYQGITYGGFNANSNTDKDTQVWALRNGDTLPPFTPYPGQVPPRNYLQAAGYLDANGKVKLADNQVIYLFEVTTTNKIRSDYDMQDIVVLATITPK